MFTKILKWTGKTSSIILIIAGIIFLCIFLFLGPLAEIIIEKYDEKWTGRRIEMAKMRINLFTGSINIHDVTLFEPARQDTFVHVKRIYTNLELTHFIKGEYDVQEVLLYRPYTSVVQSGFSFNFDDLIKRFLPTTDSTTVEESSTEPLHYRIEKIHIDSARVHYREINIGSELTLVNFSSRCPLIAWDEPEHHYEFSTDLGSGGSLQSSMDININSLLYSLAAKSKGINIAPFLPYVQDVMKVNQLDGLVSIEFDLKGDFNKPEAIALRAKNSLQDFKLADFQNDMLVSTGLLTFDVDSLNTEKEIYNWGGFSMDRPFLKFELYTDGDNFTRLLKDTTTTTTSSNDSIVAETDYSNPFRLLADYANNIINEYVMKEYNIDSVVISKGHVVYNDYTLEDKFSAELDSLFISSGKLNSKNSNLDFNIHSRINTTGIMEARLSMDPHNLENLELVYSIKDVRMSSFSPYSVYYAAHPFLDGLVYYNNETKVLNHIIESKNKLEIRKIEVGKKVKNSTAFDLPLRLAIVILRDRNGNINLDLPVEGNLDDPKYKLGKVVWGIIKNLLVKAATSPFNLLARAIDADEDDLRSIKFNYLSDSLTKKQEKNLNMLGRVLKLKPELKIELIYLPGHPDETEMLAAYEAKKRYVLKIDSTREDEPTPAQVKQIEDLSINDSSFINYLNRNLFFEGSVPPIEKCKRFVGKRRLNNKMEAIISNRKKLLASYLASQEQLKPEAFEIVDGEENQKSDGAPRFDVRFGMADE